MAKNLHSKMTIKIKATLPLGAGTNDAIADATSRNQKLIEAMAELGYREIETIVDMRRARIDGDPDTLPALPDHLRRDPAEVEKARAARDAARKSAAE